MPAMAEPTPLGRVLLAEDDRGVRESLVRALTFEGYEVQRGARRRAKRSRPSSLGSPTSSSST